MSRGHKAKRVHVEAILFSELPVGAESLQSNRIVSNTTSTGDGSQGSRPSNGCVLCIGLVMLTVTVVIVALWLKNNIDTTNKDMKDLSHAPYPPSPPYFQSV
jgi:hypothetical protein